MHTASPMSETTVSWIPLKLKMRRNLIEVATATKVDPIAMHEASSPLLRLMVQSLLGAQLSKGR